MRNFGCGNGHSIRYIVGTNVDFWPWRGKGYPYLVRPDWHPADEIGGDFTCT